MGHPADSSPLTFQQLPVPKVLGHNGSFGVFRVLEQDCEGFEKFLDEQAMPGERELLAARMLGRWRNGVPLALSPQTWESIPPLSDEQKNAFDYRPTALHTAMADDSMGS